MKEYSKTMWVCVNAAKEKGEELFPYDCIEIMEKYYGVPRMEIMKPWTIRRKIADLMGVITETTPADVAEDVENWLNDF